MVIHLEARLEREAVNRGDVRKKGKMKRRLGGQISGSAYKVFAGYHYRRFAPKLDHLGDGLRVPGLQLMDYECFFSFLLFHGWIPVGVSDSSRARPSSRGRCILRAGL